jgi:hypothetical protein
MTDQQPTLREAFETVVAEYSNSRIKVGIGINQIKGTDSFLLPGGYIDQGRLRLAVENGASLRVEKGEGGKSTIYTKDDANSMRLNEFRNLSMHIVQEHISEFYAKNDPATKKPAAPRQ